MVTALPLFLGQEQYGILVVETEPEDMLLMHLVSLQISGALNFYYLNQQQVRMQKRLETLVDEVNEKNKILGFISAYDELTGILNRRGFMEKAMQLIHSTDKKDAILFIADLDHLKEINDCYGHVAGDFAIRESAKILMDIFGEDGYVARIGGDEFVAILSYDYRLDGEDYIRKIKEACDKLNSTKDKKFYVEMSVGYTVFRCDSSVDFNYLLSNSDRMLYEAKQLRRKSVRKEN
jgi:diguanylate cyclase (GGDEF)-like protein